MLRNSKLILSIFFLLSSLYCFGVLSCHCIKYNEASAWGFTAIGLRCMFIITGIVLFCVSFKKHRIGRFNIDIFTTLYLFLVFMLGFLVPNHINFQYTHTAGFFGFLKPFVHLLGENHVGIHEILLFIGLIVYGLTIGEHKQKYYE